MATIFESGISRRALIAAAAGTGLLGLRFANAGETATPDESADGMMGLVSIYKLGALTLHCYMAPGSSAAVTTQIVETASELHIIDTQFVQALATEVRAYIDSLGKPIAGVYLSHWHPDHVLGGSQFSDLPYTTTAEISKDCESNQQTYLKRKETFKDDTPLVLPKGTMQLGVNSWDGLQVVINQVTDCESEHALTFHIPEAGLMIVQDLMFNNAHAFPLGNQTNWISALNDVRNTEGLRLLGCGHGLPATTGAIADSIAYLEFQKSVFGTEKDAEAAIAALTKKFPNFDGQSSLRFISALYK